MLARQLLYIKQRDDIIIYIFPSCWHVFKQIDSLCKVEEIDCNFLISTKYGYVIDTNLYH